VIAQIILTILVVFLLPLALRGIKYRGNSKSTRQFDNSLRLPSHAISAPELEWEAVAVAEDADIRVSIRRGKQSILIGETNIHTEDFSKIVESLNTIAMTRAMEMNSMGIKWEGDTGSMVPVEVADRYKEDRDNFQKQLKDVHKALDNVLTPDGFASLVEMYMHKVSPTSEIGTIRVLNNGHPIAEIPPDPSRPRLQGPVGWQYGSGATVRRGRP
jgi:hypothetical protein